MIQLWRLISSRSCLSNDHLRCARRRHEIETSASFPEAAASSLRWRETLSRLRSVSLVLSFSMSEREGRTSADTLINGLGHAIPRDPFEKLRTIDLARFRNEGCTLTASLSPCTEHSDDDALARYRYVLSLQGESEIETAERGGGRRRQGKAVHRWLRLPRWMYKGELGSRELGARAFVHM